MKKWEIGEEVFVNNQRSAFHGVTGKIVEIEDETVAHIKLDPQFYYFLHEQSDGIIPFLFTEIHRV